MIFSTPEREFLRLSAMAEPDWPAMTRIARTALHYGELRRLALLHQLDGVVAWRLLDERMDGIAPNIVRDDCQRYMDWVDGYNQSYWSAVSSVLTNLDKLGIRYAIQGGPAQYLPLGITHWPRTWDGLQLDLDITENHIAAVVQDLNATVKQWGPRHWELLLPNELHCDVTAYPTDDDPYYEGATWTPWDRPLRPVSVLGLDCYVADPTIYLAQLAVDTWLNVAIHSSPLSLWLIARLAAWLNHPAFDPAALDTLLSTNIAEKRGKMRGARPCPADTILWLLEIANRVYDIPLPDVKGIEPHIFTMSVAQYVGPSFTVYGCIDPAAKYARLDRAVLAAVTDYYYTVRHFQWRWPGDEQMIFDHRMDAPFEGRIASGVWQEMGDSKGVDNFRLDGVGHRHWGETFQRDITHA